VTDRHPDEDLSALLDGELDPPGESQVRAHLAGCSACREELERLERARDALRLLAPVDPPPEIVDRFWARIRRFLRIVAGAAALGGIAVVVVLWAASPERAVHPPVDEVGAHLPAFPAGKPLPAGRTPEGWAAPAGLDGMPLVSIRAVGAMTAATYAGGTGTLMLLEEPGVLEDDDYPVVPATLDGRQGVAYSRAGDEEFTWQSGPMVMTLVGTPGELVPAGAALPSPPQSRSLLARARSLCRELVEDLTGA